MGENENIRIEIDRISILERVLSENPKIEGIKRTYNTANEGKIFFNKSCDAKFPAIVFGGNSLLTEEKLIEEGISREGLVNRILCNKRYSEYFIPDEIYRFNDISEETKQKITHHNEVCKLLKEKKNYLLAIKAFQIIIDQGEDYCFDDSGLHVICECSQCGEHY